jgi:hypothetical protein
VISDAEIDATVDAWQRRDADAVAARGAAIGVALELDKLTNLEGSLRYTLDKRDVVGAIAAALDADHGIGFREVLNDRAG